MLQPRFKLPEKKRLNGKFKHWSITRRRMHHINNPFLLFVMSKRSDLMLTRPCFSCRVVAAALQSRSWRVIELKS